MSNISTEKILAFYECKITRYWVWWREFTYLASRMGADASGITKWWLPKIWKNHYSINVEQKQISQFGKTRALTK